MRFLILFLSLVLISSGIQSQNCQHQIHQNQNLKKLYPRNLDYAIKHYDLFFDFHKKAQGEIDAVAQIEMYFLNDVSEVELDIKSYTIDQVKLDGQQLVFSSSDSLLRISPSLGFEKSDTVMIEVSYSGSTHRESANFGGFFFRAPYAYNVGVAFGEIPHNFGRVWYPCLDNFTSRATYTTRTLTYGGDISVSSGILTKDSIVAGDTLYREWHLTHPIPTYLQSLAVAPYEILNWNHQGNASTYPVELYALATDTARLRASFIDLDSAIHYYEDSYYNYVWQKVGFSILPMNGGAMEHATNIAYPSFAVNGNTSFETLMAHELSHHWWGNLVTCDEASEMWLNEGWASFSEFLFLEKRYGWERAVEDIQSVQYDVLKNTNHEEGGYRSVANIPEPYIYGSHVYDKGSIVALALRTYMGASFESSIQSFFNDNQFKSINSDYLKDELERISGLDLDPFFDSWVYEPGFVDYFLGDINYNSSTKSISPVLTQLTTGTNRAFDEVPLDLTYVYSDFSKETESFRLPGTVQSKTLREEPAHVILNEANRLPLACTWDEKFIFQNGNPSLDRTDFQLNVQSVQDSAWIRMEQHWSEAPISLQNAIDLKVRIAPDRHWTLRTISPMDLSIDGVLRFDGRSNAPLDDNLAGVPEDSLILMYRPLYQGEWAELSNYSLNTAGNANDAFGVFTLNDMPDGHYAIGIKDQSVGRAELSKNSGLLLFPNPTDGMISIKALEKYDSFQILNMEGKLLKELLSPQQEMHLDLSLFKAGTYVLKARKDGRNEELKFIVK